MIIKNAKICRSTLSKLRGLMFSRKRNLVFVFDNEQKINLHNFFVFFSINLIFLDKNKKVIEVKKDFRPFFFYSSKNNARYLIETPFYIKVRIGDKLTWSK